MKKSKLRFCFLFFLLLVKTASFVWVSSTNDERDETENSLQLKT